MWQLNNKTPYAADNCWVRGWHGEEVWLVAVKASFTIDPVTGETEVSPEQPPVNKQPVYRGEPATTSLRYGDDLILKKSGTDIILNATAYAPDEQQVQSLAVAVKIADWSKQLQIFGERYWWQGRAGLEITPAAPFSTMPIIYERAYGGRDSVEPDTKFFSQNPVGIGFFSNRDQAIDKPLPNIELADTPIRHWDDQPQPAGFGYIAPNWQPRAAYAGTYDQGWQDERQPLLPSDFDWQFYRCAPVDQQFPGYLFGGESITLHHLTPDGRLDFNLPKIRLGFRTVFKNGSEVHSAQLHTVIIEPDDLLVSLVWLTALPCHGRDDKLEYTTIYTKEWVG